MTSSLLRITISDIVPRILEFGWSRLPREACGIIVPDLSKTLDEWVVELDNRSSDPLNSYEIDPVTLATLLADAEGPQAWSEVLIWHTHPSGHVGPSKRDMESRNPALKYLVVSLPGGEATLF